MSIISKIGQKAAKVMRGTIGSILVYGTLLTSPAIGNYMLADILSDDLDTGKTETSTALTVNLLENIKDVTQATGNISMLRDQISASLTAGDPELVGKYTTLRDSALSARSDIATDIAVSTLNSPFLTEGDYQKISNQFSDVSQYSSIILPSNAHSFDEVRAVAKSENGFAEMSRMDKAERMDALMDERETAGYFGILFLGIMGGVFGWKAGALIGKEVLGEIEIRNTIADGIEHISKPKPKIRIN